MTQEIPCRISAAEIRLDDKKNLVVEVLCQVGPDKDKPVVFGPFRFDEPDPGFAGRLISKLLRVFNAKSLSKLRGTVCVAVVGDKAEVLGLKQFSFDGGEKVLASELAVN